MCLSSDVLLRNQFGGSMMPQAWPPPERNYWNWSLPGASAATSCYVAAHFLRSRRYLGVRASDREVNAPEKTHIEVVHHVAAVGPAPS